MTDSPRQQADKKTNSFIPNSYSTPNDFVDQLMHLLQPNEWVVLSFICRHIFGWQNKIASRTAAISLNMLEKGFEMNGHAYHGCGLSRPTISAVLGVLLKYRIIEKVGEASERGQEYRIPESDASLDYAGLKLRVDEKLTANQKRTTKAREVKRQSSEVVSPTEGVNPTNRGGLIGLTGGGKSDLPNKNKDLKPSIKPPLEPAVPDVPTSKRKANPIYDWVALNIFKVTPESGELDKDIDGWIGANSAKLINAEKLRLNIPKTKPLTDEQRSNLAAQLPGLLKFYHERSPGLSVPQKKGAFGILVTQWYAAGKPYSIIQIQPKFVPVPHDDYVSETEAV